MNGRVESTHRFAVADLPRDTPRWHAPVLVAGAAFIVVASLLFYRSTLGGMELRDFRDAVYYPTVAFLNGNNPYDATHYMRLYPVEQLFPPYAPMILTLHLPLSLMPFATAQVVYYVLTLALMLVLSYVTFAACELPITATRVFGLATFLIASRPGSWTLALGQVTVPVVIGTYLALRYAGERRWLAAVGLAVALLKPTYGVPLGVLLLVRGDIRSVIYGGIIAALTSVPPVAALLYAAGGATKLIASLQHSYASFASEPYSNFNSFPGRTDVVAVMANSFGCTPGTATELAIDLTVLACGALAVWRLAGRADARSRVLSNSIACLTLLTCTYHQAYDLLLLALPLTALVAGRQPPGLAGRTRWIVLAVLGLPMINYLSAGPALRVIDLGGPWCRALMVVNGSALIVALAVYLTLALRRGAAPALPGGRARRRRSLTGIDSLD